MNINERVDQAHQDSFRWFPAKANDVTHQLLALAGEVGEVANLIKRVEQGSRTWAEVEQDVIEEIIDVQTYLYSLMAAVNDRQSFVGGDAIDWDRSYEFKRVTVRDV